MNDLGLLRTIHDEEIELMRIWRNSPEVRSKMYTQHEISEEEHRDWWKKTVKGSDSQYFMFENHSTPLGIVGFSRIDRANSNCFWAFYASPKAPQGTGSQMEYLALDYIFYTLRLHKVSCEVLAFNVPVIRLHHKFGFVTEGVFRQHYKNANQFIDVVRLGLLADEWAEKREALYVKLTKLARRSQNG